LWVGAGRRHYAKIQPFAAGENVVVLAGSGVGTRIKSVMEDVAKKLTEDMNDEQIVQMADDILLALVVKLKAMGDDDCPFFLMAVRTPAGTRLFENQGDAMFVRVVTGSQCIGVGNTLGVYLSDWLFDSTLPMARGRAIAAYLIQQVKDYEPDYCGGDTQIWMVPTSLDEDVRDLSKSEVALLDSALEDTRNKVRTLITHGTGILGVDFNEETLQRRDETLDTAVSAARTNYVQLSGVNALTFTGTVSAVKVEPSQQQGKDGCGNESADIASDANQG